MQIGGFRNYLKYPLTPFGNFKGCIRNIIDNGMMYDLKFPLLEANSGLGCPAIETICPVCVNGYCDMTKFPHVCSCYFGWTGLTCSSRKYV